MTEYILEVTNGSDKGTITPDAGFRYTENLNEINEADIKLSGSGQVKRGLLAVGAQLDIYKNGTLVFKGVIDIIDQFVGGTIGVHASGYETWLAKERGTYSNSPWTSTASATIFSDIIGDSTAFTAGSISAGYSLDYRVSLSTSIWNAITNLAKKTEQDIVISYSADTIGISDHAGSSAVVATLNEGKELRNLRKNSGLPRGNHILVYGKGDGDNQITGSAQDATSIAAYGRIKMTVVDKSVISTTEADRLASSVLATNKDPAVIYDFELTNPEYGPLAAGDHIVLSALDQDVDNEEVRIVGIERGDGPGGEFTRLQVTNPALKMLMRTQNKLLAGIHSRQDVNDTYMQGSGNTEQWSRSINAKNGAPFRMSFYLDASRVTDEAGNVRVDSITLDYDVDEYRSDIGTATDSAEAVDLTPGNTAVHKHSPSDDGHVHSVSSVTTDNMSMPSFIDDDDWSASADTTWEYVGNVNIDSGTYGFIVVHLQVVADGWTGTDTIGIRVEWDSTPFWQEIEITYDTDFDPIYRTVIIPVLAVTTATKDLDFYIYSAGNNAYDGWYDVFDMDTVHTHAITALTGTQTAYADVDDNNMNPSLVGNSANHQHTVTIGDDVSDAGSVNATEVDIYLDKWNGSSWVNQHSIMSTGKTLDQGVDISDSGSYPDAAGWWRVRIEPDSATPDFVQAIVTVKYSMDN